MPGWAAIAASTIGTAARQCGHSKSANSTSVTGASSGPFEGEPSSAIVFTAPGSYRSLKARWSCSSVAPSRTAWAIHLAACAHGVHGRFSFTHCARDTGTLGHGANRSFTSELNSRRSRGVIALVSTPGRVTSRGSLVGAELVGCGSIALALGSRQLDHAPTATTSRSRPTTWRAERKAPNV